MKEWEHMDIDCTVWIYDGTEDVLSDESLGMSHIHYNFTGILLTTCDDYWFHKKRISKDYLTSFVFISIVGLVPYFTISAEESMLEETIIDCMLDQSNPSTNLITWLEAQHMHFLLEIS